MRRRVFIHVITHDTGHAPCVQEGILSMNICKQRIRRIAKEGDLVIGIMSQARNPRASALKNRKKGCGDGGSSCGSLEYDENALPEAGHGTFCIIYAMIITEVITMQQYDDRYAFTRRDSIYDFKNQIVRYGYIR